MAQHSGTCTHLWATLLLGCSAAGLLCPWAALLLGCSPARLLCCWAVLLLGCAAELHLPASPPGQWVLAKWDQSKWAAAWKTPPQENCKVPPWSEFQDKEKMTLPVAHACAASPATLPRMPVRSACRNGTRYGRGSTHRLGT